MSRPSRWRGRAGAVVVALGVGGCSGGAGTGPIDLRGVRFVDLTHPFTPETLYWPTSPSGFRLEQLAFGPTPGGWFYSSYAFSAPEHGGTHLDAPIHFFEGGLTTDRIPLEQLIVPAVVIDITAESAIDRDARLTPEQVARHEADHGRIPAGAMVLLKTGWDARWGRRLEYFGDSVPGDASNLHFPGFGEDAARILVEERDVAGLGIDSPSIDHGPSKDFAVHRVLAARNGVALENLRGLDQVPAVGATVLALPMKIANGSGGPVRVVALVR
ncbi:MAG: cyclase family protein [Gemmatimonadetes bacterium]|nr:cyclase family protein [Gemmatimonadota bacterium]